MTGGHRRILVVEDDPETAGQPAEQLGLMARSSATRSGSGAASGERDTLTRELEVLALREIRLEHRNLNGLLFGGRLSRVLTTSIPTWFMEGMASYFAKDEDEKDRMFIRDAVNSDVIPPITRVNITGYPAYRFGHAFFDFVEAEWGKDAVRELVFEFRSFLGRDIAVALRKTFGIDPGPVDFYGNPLPPEGRLSIGAHEARTTR